MHVLYGAAEPRKSRLRSFRDDVAGKMTMILLQIPW